MSLLDEGTGRRASERAGLDTGDPDPAGATALRAMSDARHIDDFDMRHLRYFLTVVAPEPYRRPPKNCEYRSRA